tara:strand:- start:19 stop:789 length:771 start_codon:yes stop_codon:yes gene_type:complete
MNQKYNERITMVHTLLGNKCAVCGTTVGPFEIDHENPLDKSFDLSNCYSYKLSKIVKESKKCQLLCEPCHKEKTFTRDQIIINYKRKSFFKDWEEYNPILNSIEYRYFIDENKKGGREFIDYVEKLSKINDVPFHEMIYQISYEISDALSYYYVFLSEETGPEYEEYDNSFKKYIDDLKEGDNKRYQRVKMMSKQVEKYAKEVYEQLGDGEPYLSIVRKISPDVIKYPFEVVETLGVPWTFEKVYTPISPNKFTNS